MERKMSKLGKRLIKSAGEALAIARGEAGSDALPEDWRRVLSNRSTRDKIGIAIDCDLAPVGELTTVAELVRAGLIEWIDRTCLAHLGTRNTETGEVRRCINADVYRLTEKGIALCDAHGIERH
jgi:hypothetical protein